MTDVPTLNIPLILHAILEEYVLPWDGDHGIAHWARVLENGLRLAEETGANIEVVQLFALLHDSQRVNEGLDPKHGPRAAVFALEVRGLLFDLPDHEFRLLHRACAGHTHERTHPNIGLRGVSLCFLFSVAQVWGLRGPGRPRDYSLGLPQIPTCALNTSGSSRWGISLSLTRPGRFAVTRW